MKASITIGEREFTITTDFPSSCHGQPVVLVDGQITDIPVAYEPDECGCNVLDLLANVAGIHDGPVTRRNLHLLADDVLPPDPYGADYDAVITEFKRRKEATQ